VEGVVKVGRPMTIDLGEGRIECPVFRLHWESELDERGTCSLEEFIYENRDCLLGDDVDALVGLRPGQHATIMGGACVVLRAS